MHVCTSICDLLHAYCLSIPRLCYLLQPMIWMGWSCNSRREAQPSLSERCQKSYQRLSKNNGEHEKRKSPQKPTASWPGRCKYVLCCVVYVVHLLTTKFDTLQVHIIEAPRAYGKNPGGCRRHRAVGNSGSRVIVQLNTSNIMTNIATLVCAYRRTLTPL